MAIQYLFTHRTGWKGGGRRQDAGLFHDRPGGRRDRSHPKEVPVGFKWFVDGLYSGELALAARERARAPSFRARTVPSGPPTRMASSWRCWRPEILAVTGKFDPLAHYDALKPDYVPATPHRMLWPTAPRRRCSPSWIRPLVEASHPGCEPHPAKLTKVPVNDAAIGGLESGETENGWFAARPLRHRVHLQDSTWRASGGRHLTSSSRKPSRIVSAALAKAGV